MKTLRKVAIIGGARVPFARQNTSYAEASNIEMLGAALRGVVDKFKLEGQRLGEVAAGAVLKHSRDANISREAVLDSGLSPQTPAYDVQQACATSLESAILVGNKIAVGQIDVGIRRPMRRSPSTITCAACSSGSTAAGRLATSSGCWRACVPRCWRRTCRT
jgi:acetyl-CoA C-acetyltransferase